MKQLIICIYALFLSISANCQGFFQTHRVGLTQEEPVIVINNYYTNDYCDITIFAEIVSDGSYICIERGYCWNTTSSPSVLDNKQADGSGIGTFDKTLTVFNANTTYYFSAYMIAVTDTFYSSDVSVHTDNYPSFSFSSNNVSYSTATITLSLSANGNSITDRDLYYRELGDATYSNISVGSGQGGCDFELSGLYPSKTYQYYGSVGTDCSTEYSTVSTYTMLTPYIATVTTTSATNIGETTATSGGNVVDGVGEFIIERGVCWNTTGSPSVLDNTATTSGTLGSFSVSLTGLPSNTTIYTRSYAKTSYYNGDYTITNTGYGGQESFTTNPSIPSYGSFLYYTAALPSVYSLSVSVNIGVTSGVVVGANYSGADWKTLTITGIDGDVNSIGLANWIIRDSSNPWPDGITSFPHTINIEGVTGGTGISFYCQPVNSAHAGRSPGNGFKGTITYYITDVNNQQGLTKTASIELYDSTL